MTTSTLDHTDPRGTGSTTDLLRAQHRAPAPRTLLDILHATATEYPDSPAIEAMDATYTYAELIAEVGDRARALHKQGIERGDRVGVRRSSGTAELYLTILGVLAAGAAYVPVDADDPDERAETVFREAGVATVITDDGIPARRVRRLSRMQPPRPSDDAWIIFTSGSTGLPKGVAVTHRNAAAFVDAEARLFLRPEPLGPGDRVLAGLSVAFDASCEEMWLAWRNGACLVPAPRSLVRSGEELGPWLIEQRITAISTVPTLAALWSSDALAAVRLLIFGGEACPPELVSRLAAPSREIWNTYGPTEATVVACAAPLVPGEPVRIGLPLDGWDLAIVDPSGQPVPPGEPGELVIGGVGLARYLDEAKDREKYAPLEPLGWNRAYRSGDLVSFDGTGLLFHGRADDQVKIGGRRVELGEIDSLLQDLPGVVAAACTVQRSQAGTPVLVGYLTTGGAGLDIADARSRLSARLPAALVPRLAILPDLPVRTSGKVDRAALPWPLPSTSTAGHTDTLTGLEAWIAEAWESVLGAEATRVDDDFFALGGSSLTAAQLVSRLREQFPALTVAELYEHHRLGELAAHLGAQAPAIAAQHRPVAPQSRRSQLIQAALLAVPLALSGAIWTSWAALAATVLSHFTGATWLPTTPWPVLAALVVLLLTPPGRIAIAAGSARLLLVGLEPGTYPRGGSIHLRLWLAERIAETIGATNLSGAPWMTFYAKMLGARIGKHVSLHTAPPITGMLTVGARAAIEPETDLSGYWVDGDTVHIGRIVIGGRATIGARTALLPGTRIGKGTEIEAGSAVSGPVPAKQRWGGSPAHRTGKPRNDWPASSPPPGRRWGPVYGLTAAVLAAFPLVALVPALLLLVPIIEAASSPAAAIVPIILWAPVAAILSTITFALLIVASVRLLAIGLRPGTYPMRSRSGWQAWSTERLTDSARTFLFPLYASVITPLWLRLLGARVGKNVEASTVLLLPKFTTINDGAFLADDTLVAGYELGGGWVRIGRTKVGKRAFLGNSGMASPGRKVPKNGLVAVLSTAPRKAKRGSSWLGSPPVKLRRPSLGGDTESRTYAPPVRLRLLRAVVELARMVPVIATFLLGTMVLATLVVALDRYGIVAALLLSGPVVALAAAIAGLAAILAKKALVGRIREHETPLWSSFVWRNELADTFTEMLAAPWCLRLCMGTLVGNAWLRGMGASIGRGAWCETYWLPEADLVTLGDGATVNRGSVVQTHLFHDRVMSVGPVTLGNGATLGPHSVVLPAASLGDSATVGPASLVMRGDAVPPSSRWRGNPIAPWTTAT